VSAEAEGFAQFVEARQRIRRRDDPEIYVRRAMVNSWASWRRRRWWGERATGAVPDVQAAGDVAADQAAFRNFLASIRLQR